MNRIALSWAFLFGLFSSEALALKSICVIADKNVCAEGKCRPIENNITVEIDWDKNTYSRCDSKGCSEYPASVTRSGEFLNVSLPQGGTMAKISISNSAFLEVATLGMIAFISNGICQVK